MPDLKKQRLKQLAPFAAPPPGRRSPRGGPGDWAVGASDVGCLGRPGRCGWVGKERWVWLARERASEGSERSSRRAEEGVCAAHSRSGAPCFTSLTTNKIVPANLSLSSEFGLTVGHFC